MHRLQVGRPLILGGVTIEHKAGLLGHSDADVLTHAIIDALLGAAALGDIGQMFPDSDPRWKGADSLDLLETVVQMVADEGYRVGNVDTTLVLERPRLRPHIAMIRAELARVLRILPESVSVKATTSEKMGFVGREEGVAAHAVCILIGGA